MRKVRKVLAAGSGLMGFLRRGGSKKAIAEEQAAKQAQAKKDSVFKAPRPPEGPQDPAWPKPRVRLMDRMWGVGHVLPGGDDHIVDIFRVFSPNNSMSMLQVGAGQGGDGRALALAFGVWVTCIEKSEVLVESGMKESYKHGLEKKAPVVSFVPERMKVRPNGFDVVFSRLGMHTLPDKELTMEQIAVGLKPSGQMLLIEFMPGEKADSRALESWATQEPERPHLISGPKMAELIRGHDLDLRVVQDVSADYRKMVMMGFARFLGTLTRKELEEDRALGRALLKEAEMWMRRLALIDTGVLRVVRFHAIAPATKRRKKLPVVD